MEFPALWSGITPSVLGAPVNSTCYLKKIVNSAIIQSGKVRHKVLKIPIPIETSRRILGEARESNHFP